MNLIFNFSSIPLTPAMESVLNKGLNFCPNPSKVKIKTFVNSVKSELIGSELNKIKPNITKEELEALEELIKLQKDGKIVIQPGDKNCGICILDRKDYIYEAN